MLKHCALGDHMVPIKDFHKNKASKDGLYHSCKVHVRTRGATYWQKNKVKIKRKRQMDKMQVNAFKAFFKAALIGGKTRREAFASAICGSNDTKFAQLPDGSLDKWLAVLKKGKVVK